MSNSARSKSPPRAHGRSPSPQRAHGRFKLVISAVVVIGLAAAGAALLTAGRGNETPAEAVPVARVLVAKRNIPSGLTVSALLGTNDPWIEVSELPVDVVLEDALVVEAELADLAGDVFATEVRTGGQIRRSSLVTPGTQQSTAIGVPTDAFEITLAVDPVDVIGGLVRPGQELAAIATFQASLRSHATTIAIAQNLLVVDVSAAALANDEQTNAQRPDALGVSQIPDTRMFVTFAVDIAEAEKLVFAAEYGDVTFALHGDQASALASRGFNRWTFFGETAPPVRNVLDIDRSQFTPEELQSAAPPAPVPPAPNPEDAASTQREPERPEDAADDPTDDEATAPAELEE